ncbi:non-ribosomal peptide synthetase [Catellatospora methionotrophica]|uniref:non-ribosomal peptide synthetase n=1 Tax=Catellatospora methionotrophica TaxID=121620 RepID=UPI003407D20B
MQRGLDGVHRLVERWALRTPHAVAVRDGSGGRELTFARLWDESAAVAAELTARGAGHGSIVAIAMSRGAGFVVAALGVVRAGAAYLPLDPAGPVHRWDEIVAAAQAGHVLVAGTGDDHPRAAVRVALAEITPVGGYDDVDAAPELPLCVQYTSGTTGRPKGVVVPHRAVWNLVSDAAYCPLGPGDVVAGAANPAFDATTFEMWSTLTAGATLQTLPDLVDAGLDGWLEQVAAGGVTTMFLTTSLFHMIARERPDALASLRTLLVGGEQLELPLARRVLASAPPDRLVNVYGPTETTTFATYHDCTLDGLGAIDRVPIGRPLQSCWVDVVDADGRPVADGAEGELVIGGAGVALGYLHDEELSAQRFVDLADGRGVRYRSGDQARRLPGGLVEVMGRKDRQVKMRGFRIELPEIEHRLLATGLVDAAVVEKVGDGPSAYLAAFVLPAPALDPTAGQLRAALGTVLPDYMVPQRWQVRTSMPLGPTGKTDRAALLRELTDGSPATPAPAHADDRVRAIWCEVLGVGEVDPAVDFIGLGGNSILAVQVSARVRETLAVECDPIDVLLAEDVTAFASRIAGAA